MSKHTPGPWKAYDEFIYDDNSKTIAEVRTYQSGEMPWQANARLMAASPELFEILDALLGFDSAASYRARTRGYQLIQELKRANK